VIALLGGVAAVTAIVLGLVWISQERILFQPPRVSPAAPLAPLRYVAADGQPLLAYLVKGDSAPSRILIAFHGNADLAVWQIPWATEVMRRTGYAVLLPEYRGYGGLAGRPTYAATRLDAKAAYLVARDTLGFHAEAIALFGHSLGSAVAAELARDVSPSVLLLQSPFTSAREMAATTFRPLAVLWKWIGRIHYDTEEAVAGLSSPVWITHGEEDAIIPLAMGRRVFLAARNQGEFLIVPGAGHNDLSAVDPSSYWRWLTGALSVKRERD
jgi:pimeloyl-ACP methyl ester carboxylesterase